MKEKTGIDYKTTITLADTFLPGPPREGYEGCCGGVILSARGGTIVLRNTLDARLELAFYELKPAIRGILFGVFAYIFLLAIVAYCVLVGTRKDRKQIR